MQNRKIKLIWDFRGPDAQATAEHHTIHLRFFCMEPGDGMVVVKLLCASGIKREFFTQRKFA